MKKTNIKHRLYPLLFVMLQLFLMTACSEATETKNSISDISATAPPQDKDLQVATFAGGCFWCTEAVFERVEGVEKVISGYAGGPEKDPTYKEVSAGKTGHAESIQVYYHPKQVSYQELLEIFFATHDPTTLNRQGPDVGKQYRSAIFYHSDQQKKLAQEYMQKLEQEKRFPNPVVTQLQPFKKFYPAENYHQDYYKLNPQDSYVVSVARPKIRKFEKEFKEKLKSEYR